MESSINLYLSILQKLDPLRDQEFISIDWGTSRFRMSWVTASGQHTRHSFRSDHGVKQIFHECQTQNLAQSKYFLDFLIKTITANFPDLDSTLPIIISGMASSSIGVEELPYAKTPFSSQGESIVYKEVGHPDLGNKIYIISGVATDSDVMRGEETQMIGICNSINSVEDLILILPGTHSKHIFITNQEMIDFRTYLTGELFEVILKHSVLKNSIGKVEFDESAHQWIRAGARDGTTTKLLNHLFQIRASHVLQKSDPKANYFYLSGLLVANELINLKSNKNIQILLAASKPLDSIYEMVAKTLELPIKIIENDIIDKSVFSGHDQILKRITAAP